MLDLLACQRNEGKVCGRILYDGNLASPKWRHLITLVSRENQFNCISTLTVREIVATSARLRHADGHEQMADEIIDLLGLTKCAHVRIGSETVRGISGGEKKRVAVALGLIAHPRVVLLDEPTTGLHFKDVQLLIDVLHKLVDQGNTVVVIEHHLDVLKVCDHLIDVGPEGGKHGGTILAQGIPEDVAACKESHTGRFLKPLLP